MKTVPTVVLLLSLVAWALIGCGISEGVKYSALTDRAETSREALFNLKLDMTKTDVLKIIGKPDRTEQYRWGSIWLYRTSVDGATVYFSMGGGATFTPSA